MNDVDLAGFPSRLFSKLMDMQLWDDTLEPHDQGYQAAVDEIRAWLSDELKREIEP